MSDSILNETKKVLGVAEDYEAFDIDILMHINSVFSDLNQLGVGPKAGFQIVDKEDTWATFLGNDPRLNSVKTYVYLRVRMIFDPPGTSYLINSLNKQAEELAWRLNVVKENDEYENPFEDEEEV